MKIHPRRPREREVNQPPIHRLLPSILLSAGLLAAGCSSTPKPLDEAVGTARVERAEEALARGELDVGVRELVRLRKRGGLPPALRDRIERRLVDIGLSEIERYEGEARPLRRLFEADYPERVRVRAGLQAARALFEDDHPVSAFELVQRVDREFPHHSERALAGRILGELGLHLIERRGRYSIFFRYRTKGVRALEYLVLRYPLDPQCDEAYFALSRHYERVGEVDYALERVEDLLIYHPGSPYAVAAQARLPYLRLVRLARNDYDRRELAVASEEIRNWLTQHAGHELEGWVRELEAACARRLAESDLSLARYYDRIGSADGRALHARRALAIAARADLAEEAALARSLLGPESVPPTDATPRPAGAETAGKTAPDPASGEAR